MWNDVLNMAISNGIFAALFVGLFMYTLKDSSAREKKYVQLIDKLSAQLDRVNDIDKNIKDLKTLIETNEKNKNKNFKDVV